MYMSTRLVVNVSQVYFPMYITETIKMDKVNKFDIDSRVMYKPYVSYFESFN